MLIFDHRQKIQILSRTEITVYKTVSWNWNFTENETEWDRGSFPTGWNWSPQTMTTFAADFIIMFNTSPSS
jgi:hypothetical protein